MGQYKHLNIKLTIINKKSFKMKYLLSVVSLAVLANSKPQLSFGSGSSDDANPRLGLLATNLGLSPTAETEGRTGSLTEFGGSPSGRVPGAPSVGTAPAPASVPAPVPQTSPPDQCCCIPADQDCFDLYAVEDLVGQGLIDPRIVNRPQCAPVLPRRLQDLLLCSRPGPLRVPEERPVPHPLRRRPAGQPTVEHQQPPDLDPGMLRGSSLRK